jgi:hypothetical protein
MLDPTLIRFITDPTEAARRAAQLAAAKLQSLSISATCLGKALLGWRERHRWTMG